MQKLKKSLRDIFYSAKMKIIYKKKTQARGSAFKDLTLVGYPLGISDEFLFRNNFNDQKMHLFEQGRFFHTQGNHFPAG